MSFPDSKTRRGRVIDEGDTSPTLGTSCQVGVIQIGQLYGTEREPNPQAGRVYSAEGISPCLDSMRGGNRMPKVAVQICEDGTCRYVDIDPEEIRIRRLTPKECFRLQGWPDECFDKAEFVNSNSQLYKQAGNGVTVNVIQAIGKGFL